MKYLKKVGGPSPPLPPPGLEALEKFVNHFPYLLSLLEGLLVQQRTLLRIQLVGVAYLEVSTRA